MLKRRFSKKEIEPGALPLFLAFLNEPKTRVPYPSAPFGEWAAIMRAIPRIKLLLQPYQEKQQSAFSVRQSAKVGAHAFMRGRGFQASQTRAFSFFSGFSRGFQIGTAPG